MLRYFPITIKLFTLLFLLAVSECGFSQSTRGTVRGKVVTAKNEPATYVSIGLEGTTHGGTTNEQGEFSFRAPAGSYKLVISYVGVERVEVPVIITAGQTTDVAQITVKASLSQLNEVNVIANSANRFTSRVSTDAAKIPLAPLENAQSYTTITASLLREQQVFSIEEGLRNAPGIQKMWDATNRAGDGGGYFSLRGFPTQVNVRNGIAGVITSSIDNANIEKVEVIKGPSATLFGGGLTTFGGLINRVTKKPYENFGFEINQSVGNYRFQNGGWSYRTGIDLNTPLTADKNVLFRVNASQNFEGSFQNYGKGRNFFITPSLAIKASQRLSFLLESEIAVGRNSARPFFFFFDPPAALGTNGAKEVKDIAIDYKQAYVNDDIRMYSSSVNFFGQMNYKISDKFTSQTLFSTSSTYSDGSNPFFYMASDNTIRGFFQDPTIPSSPNARGYIVRADQVTKDSKLSALEVQHNLNGDFKTGSIRHRFVFGLDFQRINSNQVFLSNYYDYVPLQSATFNYGALNKSVVDARIAANPPSAANAFVYYYKKNTYSAYVSDVINLTDRLIASLGVRIDHFKHFGTETFDRNPDAPAFSQTAVSPKFGLIYQPIKEQLSLFANYQNGFKNPDVFRNPSNVAVIPKLQSANQFEGGVKMALFDGKLNGTLSYYNIRVTNTVRQVLGTPFYAELQDGTQVSKGFEAEVIANPWSGLNVVTGFAYNNSKITNAAANVNGLRPTTAGSPYVANFYVSYHLPESAIKGLGAGFGGNYGSKSKIAASTDGGTFELPEYYVFNGNVFYDRTKYRVGLAVNNITNKQYYTGFTTINPQRLRQLVLTASYKF